MANKNATKTIVGAFLISACVFSLFLAVSSYRQVKTAEDKFNKEKAALIKEGMDLQDRIDSLTKELKEKTAALVVVETGRKVTAEKIMMLEDENKNITKRYLKKIEELKSEKDLLAESVESAKKTPLTQVLKDALFGEENEKIKKLLNDTLYKIEMIKAGKAVDLEPIVVTGGISAQAKEMQPVEGIAEKKTGRILSVDSKNNLIVIDLGYRDNIKENERCAVLIDEKEIASANIISVRHRISAAFIDEVKYGYVINDVKEGSKVSVIEE